MSAVEKKDKMLVITNLISYPIVTAAKPIFVRISLEFRASVGPWIFLETDESLDDRLENSIGQDVELLLHRFRHDDLVAHLFLVRRPAIYSSRVT